MAEESCGYDKSKAQQQLYQEQQDKQQLHPKP
jgi:hypothetical protein